MALPSSQEGAALVLPSLTGDEKEFLASLRAYQAHVRYPTLFQLRNRQQGVLYSQENPKSGLITIAVEQETLSEVVFGNLGEFRLHQYLLCGWYDVARVLADQAKTDPQLARIPASSVHLLTGTPDGQVLAYCTLQAAALEDAEVPSIAQPKHYLQEFPRPLFASERELFGPVLFASLPALRAIPLSELGDFTCLLQNQALHSPLRTIAVIDAILSMIHLLAHPASRWRAILGTADQEARGLLAQLGVPVLYAPEAQVMVDSLSYQHYWAAEEIGLPVQGKYWPFTIAVDDLRARQNYFEHLHLQFTGEVENIRRILVAWRHQQTVAEPKAFFPPPGTRAAQIWGVPDDLLRKKRRKSDMSLLRSKKNEDSGSVLAQDESAPSVAVQTPNEESAPVSSALSPLPTEPGVLQGSALQRYKTLSLELLHLNPGMQILDVGCGNGTDLTALAALVGEEGLVVGVDHDPHVLQAAQEAHRGRAEIRVVLSPAEHLPFAHRSFDAIRADRILQDVPELEKALSEMWRVLRPGGIVNLIEPDWQAVSVYPASQAGGDDDHIVQALLKRTCLHPLIGRRLSSLLHQSGKWEHIEVRMETYLFTSWPEADAILLLSKVAQTLAEAESEQAKDIHAWLQAVAGADNRGHFIATLPLFFANAHKIGN